MTGASLFWFVAGLMSASAVFVALQPWLRTAKAMALTIAGTALLACGLYLWWGYPRLSSVPADAGDAHASRALAPMAGSQRQAAAMDSALAGLEGRLAGGGSDADWQLLAQAYDFQGRSADAATARNHKLPASATSTPAASTQAADTIPAGASIATAPATTARDLVSAADEAQRQGDYARAHAAFAKLAAMRQMTADSWADYADVTATLQGKLTGEPEGYLQAALALDPRHPKALWLMASLEHEIHQYAEAILTWKKLAAVLGPGSSDAALVAANLAEDQRLANGSKAPATDQAAAPVSVRGQVVAADALRQQVHAGLTLFIVAKSVNSPGAPVAVLRTTTDHWPVSFELNDSMAMLPERKLSTAGQVTLEARVSKSGLADRQSGDLFGETAPLDPTVAAPVQIVIARVLEQAAP